MTSKSSLLALCFGLTCTVGLKVSAQQASLSSSTLSFGVLSAGNVSSTQTITLTNTGTADLVVSSIVASGGFSASSKCSILHPAEDCTIEAGLVSSIIGSAKGVITINDNAASSPQLVNLTGTVVPPIAFLPVRTNFGTVEVGTSQTKTVKLTNNGASFAIRAISVGGDYNQTNNCPILFITGQSCVVSVTFQPRASGARAAVLSVTSLDSGFSNPLSGFTTALSGTGTGGTQTSQISLQPAALAFGKKTPFDLFTTTRTVKLTNISSTASLTVQGISAAGPISTGSSFYRISSTNCGGILPPGGACEIQVEQSPAIGAFVPEGAAGSLTIVDSDATSPNVISLTASVLPEVQLTPVSVSFSGQKVGTTSAVSIVQVTGLMDHSGVSLLPVSSSGDFAVVSAGTNPCGSKPAPSPGQSCTLGITFTPHKIGTVTGAVTLILYPECSPEQVVVDHLPCPNAQVINLTGTGQ